MYVEKQNAAAKRTIPAPLQRIHRFGTRKRMADFFGSLERIVKVIRVPLFLRKLLFHLLRRKPSPFVYFIM